MMPFVRQCARRRAQLSLPCSLGTREQLQDTPHPSLAA